MTLKKLNSEGLTNVGIQETIEFRDAVTDSYGNCEPYYYGDVKTKVESVFPFVLVKSKLFGNRMISVPFFDVGGFSGKFDSKILSLLINELNSDSVDSVEVKIDKSDGNFEKVRNDLLKIGFSEEKAKHQFILKLSSEEEMWKKFHKHTRNDVRMAMKSGMNLVRIDSEKELKSFFKLYVREMKRFGTPNHSFDFFKNLFEKCNGGFFGLNCYKDKKLAGSLIFLHGGGKGNVYVNVSNNSFRKYRPNDLLYWETIKYGIKKKLKTIDTGQVDMDHKNGSREWSMYKFKNKWLCEPFERINFVFPSQTRGISKGDKLKVFRKVWRCLPLPLIKLIGPKIRSQLGI
ncbi:peptidoglycan bridge formation glycyltransferase FemA/FemB family protein [Candidatus Woesearchaeota archaeon]|jgi:serine/alanine adding enzyme|nr:peptidoglycan bridge formation glycyltransferase FemA/FemB family protein [Candidatus Woesearchaeota archaeon]MBT6044737.1 peptidoglycan bridge formation glycyltransferase FemA/FemB family protein [Candidatus Woesearchaeota archaeon]